jgi:hypothetical protein
VGRSAVGSDLSGPPRERLSSVGSVDEKPRLERIGPVDVEKREFRNEAVRIADLTVNAELIANRVFENCQILGPAVLAPLGRTTISHSGFDGDVFEDFAWPVPDERQQLIGAVAVVDCEFFKCRFVQIGIAFPESLHEQLRSGFDPGPGERRPSPR